MLELIGKILGFISNFITGIMSSGIKGILVIYAFMVSGFLLLKFFQLSIEFLRIWWIETIQGHYVSGIKWKFIEIKIPRENIKSPKAMEQVFANWYGIYSFGLNPEEIYLEGKIEDWISAEIVATRGSIRFIVRYPVSRKNTVESAIFAQYPEAEIKEIEDYTLDFPKDLPNDEYDVVGADMILGKKGDANCLPIKTYPAFTTDATITEKKVDLEKIDPIADILETMANLKEGEYIWYQIIMQPFNGGDFKAKADNYIAKTFVKEDPLTKKKVPKDFREFTDIERETLKAINNKTSKIVFRAIPRYVYIAKKNVFDRAYLYAMAASFQVFNLGHLNFMRPAPETFTKKPRWWFRDKTWQIKKKSIYKHFIKRSFDARPPFEIFYSRYLKNRGMAPSIWSVEELATIYHFPIVDVGAPGLLKTEARKAEPPANLPIAE